ncbi:MAG: hypothetical protein JXA95_05100 [Spirochaetales bacterium]|nr:hypothetical protein [Spirochaetales bacterium]
MNKINYFLRKNPLSTSEENLFMAGIGRKDTQRQDDVIRHMMKRNTTVSRQDIIIVLELLKETVADLILDGFPVIMDMFRARVGIRGGFTSLEDEFDSRRHSVGLNLCPTGAFRNELSHKASVEKVQRVKKVREIGRLYDYRSRSFGTGFAAGAIIGIKGYGLLPEEGDPRVLLRREDGTDWLPVTEILDLTDRHIQCTLPADLAAGSYKLRIVVDEGDTPVNVDYGETITIA